MSEAAESARFSGFSSDLGAGCCSPSGFVEVLSNSEVLFFSTAALLSFAIGSYFSSWLLCDDSLVEKLIDDLDDVTISSWVVSGGS